VRFVFFSLLVSQFIGSGLSALTLGVVPQQSPFKLMKVWAPIAKYLERETGEEIVLKIEHSIPAFEKVLYGGGYDVAYMNPYHYIVANKKQGYIATVRANKKIVGILVINKKSAISDVRELSQKRFLFPAPYAFAATLLTKYELLNSYGINIDKQDKILYVNSHDSVYKGIARDIGDVGGGIERTFKNFKDKDAKESLKILYRTKSYPSHPFAFKPSVSKTTQKKLTNALLHMPKELLDSLSMKKMITTDDSEYDVVRDISKKLLLENN
jgi:phosphonate transport system substrate-binding protein